MTKTAPFGSWGSPITAESVTRAGLRFGDVLRNDGDDLYWVESRPTEGGRSAIVRRSGSGAIDDVGPDDFNARSRVHEYGGGAYVIAGGMVIASRFEDQRLFRIDRDGEPIPLTPEPAETADLRYADLDVAGTWAVGVRETHVGNAEPKNELVRIDLTGAISPIVIASGRDFYAAPRISPDHTTLAWLEWNHPNMPWDGTELHLAEFDARGHLGPQTLVTGGLEESITQPEWSPAGTLHYVSDRTGWWNIYRHNASGDEAVLPMEAEFGVPGWAFAMRRYCFLDDGTLIAAHFSEAGDRLVVLSGAVASELATPYMTLGSTMVTSGRRLYVLAGGPDASAAVVEIDIDSGATKVLRSADSELDEQYISTPEAVTFDTPDGPAHALFYPPTNPEYRGPQDTAPPLIVKIHGGPTGQASTGLNPAYLFWTSRGFGIVDVDYGGSSGYGREYRNRLRANWGVVDVRDCALAAAHIASVGKADPNQLIITGGSAGGYTTLLALALRDEFAAGASYFGISNLEALAQHTHKFESRYLDRLVGPYPDAVDVYEERSALNHLDGFNTPVILFQGVDDEVVPPAQAEMMREALVARGVPVACVMFEGEGHGFRKAANQITALESELSFYGQILGFDPAGEIQSVAVAGV